MGLTACLSKTSFGTYVAVSGTYADKLEFTECSIITRFKGIRNAYNSNRVGQRSVSRSVQHMGLVHEVMRLLQLIIEHSNKQS